MSWKVVNKTSNILLPLNQEMPHGTDFITALASNRPASKTIEKGWRTTAYDRHYLFHFRRVQFQTIQDLYEIIPELSALDNIILVLGEPTEYAIENCDQKLKRRTLSRGEDDPATLQARETTLLVMDIDGLIVPNLTLDEEGAAKVRDQLVDYGLAELKDVQLVYQWTSSAGKNQNEARIRLFGVFEEPVGFMSMKLWAAQAGVVDVSLYQPQQPIYIANPTFKGGMKDPLPGKRIGLIQGEYDTVAALPNREVEPNPNNEPVPQPVLDEDDPVLQALYEQDLVKRRLREGTWDITCPWLWEHSDDDDSGTAYMQAGYEERSRDAFKCHHNSCQGRNISDLMQHLNIRPPEVKPDVADTNELDIDPRDGSLMALIRRYIYVASENQFYDRLTEQYIEPKILGNFWNHIHIRPKAETALLQDPRLQRVMTKMFLPGNPLIGVHKSVSYLNLWQPPSEITPIEGDITPWLEHFEYLIPNQEEREHFQNWMKYKAQHQDRKINHGIVFGGQPRTGKDTLVEPLKMVLGRAYVKEPAAEELKETYTNYLHQASLILFQECQNFDKLNIENKLKPMLAAPPVNLRVRLFGKGFYETPNIVGVIFMTNHRNALQISHNDGRYYAIWSNADPRDREYYDGLYRWLREEKGFEKIAWWLLNNPVGESFNPVSPPPETEYKRNMIVFGLTDLASTIQDLIEEGMPPFNKDIILPRQIIESGAFDAYPGTVTSKKLAKALDDLGCGYKRSKAPNKRNYGMWCVRNKKKWEEKQPLDWFKELGVA